MFHVKQRNLTRKRCFYKRTRIHLVKDLERMFNINKQRDKGKIEIEFFSKEDLERILELLETH